MTNQDLFTAVYLGAPVVLVALGWGAAWLHIRSARRQREADAHKVCNGCPTHFPRPSVFGATQTLGIVTGLTAEGDGSPQPLGLVRAGGGMPAGRKRRPMLVPTEGATPWSVSGWAAGSTCASRRRRRRAGER